MGTYGRFCDNLRPFQLILISSLGEKVREILPTEQNLSPWTVYCMRGLNAHTCICSILCNVYCVERETTSLKLKMVPAIVRRRRITVQDVRPSIFNDVAESI